jgi:hypothetical protein
MQHCSLYNPIKSNFILYKFITVHIYNSYDPVLLISDNGTLQYNKKGKNL